jgi:hypothetical protein
MSVSTLMICSGAATPSKVVNFSIALTYLTDLNTASISRILERATSLLGPAD